MSKSTTTQKGQHIADLTEDEARTYLESLLWPDGAVCPHCGGRDVYRMEGAACRNGLHRCNECLKQFTVTIGTIFEDSHIPLAKWVRAFHLMCSSKKGISALQLQRNLGFGSYKTAWHMAHRIRLAMKCEPFASLLNGIVEVDETYVGGKERREFKNGVMKTGFSNKTVVLSLVERGGTKRSTIIPRVTGANARAAIEEHVAKEAVIMTDESDIYNAVKPTREHHTVNHGKRQYAFKKDGLSVHSNTAESSFSLIKRGIVGAFHHVSKKHLGRYLAEFDFRWNERKAKDVDRTAQALRQSKGKRLSYKPLTQK